MTHVTAVVVTFNRKALLERCLAALWSQRRRPDAILVVDNASTDGTRSWLEEAGWLSREGIRLLALPDNSGGAGGFCAGMRDAFAEGAEFVWIMDDDAVPQPGALEALLAAPPDPRQLLASAAVDGDRLAWPVTPAESPDSQRLWRTEEIGGRLAVRAVPFLGLLVSRHVVDAIGLPRADFFLAGDDIEYCHRAAAAGIPLFLVAASRIQHPAADYYPIRLGPMTLLNLRIPPWKRYYDVRNRLLIARTYFGSALYLKTVPSTLVKMVASVAREPRKRDQLRAYLAGLIDGLWGRSGRRHAHWGLVP